MSVEVYVEQMEAITELLKALNGWEAKFGKDLLIDSGITLRHPANEPDEPPYGRLVDEIGGVWAFQPHGSVDQ